MPFSNAKDPCAGIYRVKLGYTPNISFLGPLQHFLKLVVHGPTDGRTDGRTDGPTDRPTWATIELLSQLKIYHTFEDCCSFVVYQSFSFSREKRSHIYHFGNQLSSVFGIKYFE